MAAGAILSCQTHCQPVNNKFACFGNANKNNYFENVASLSEVTLMKFVLSIALKFPRFSVNFLFLVDFYFASQT
jgi:hypothetical protein